MSGRPTATAVQDWATELDTVGERLGRYFSRAEPRRRAVEYLRGLLSDVERKNGWQLAERLGDPTPYGVQHLLGRADWDADAVRDDLTRYAHDHLADPDGVLVVDETGFLKKGTKSAGVRRQYSGTAGRIENCQVGVFLAFAGRHGHALLDRELYLPEEWAADADRRQAAGIPAAVSFATKPQLAERMLRRAWAAGVRAAWVVADTVYGNDGKFRRFLEANSQPYVLAVQSNQQLWDGRSRSRVDALAVAWPAGVWHRASAGAGAKGPRWYDWAARAFGPVDERGWQLWLLVRRHREKTDERAYYLCRGPADTPWRELVRVAGSRWAVEEGFERAKGECGLDEYEVRSWAGWHRHVTLSLFALAVLTVARNRARRAGGRSKGGRG
ncbi:MAG TPA: IS701 family transposase [Fimbriiglobus sp.]|nr:IS701 family transposase [Fimbriiglobus sp.]